MVPLLRWGGSEGRPGRTFGGGPQIVGGAGGGGQGWRRPPEHRAYVNSRRLPSSFARRVDCADKHRLRQVPSPSKSGAIFKKHSGSTGPCFHNAHKCACVCVGGSHGHFKMRRSRYYLKELKLSNQTALCWLHDLITCHPWASQLTSRSLNATTCKIMMTELLE